MLGLSDKLLNFVYPIGSYYETSDFSFNPNTSWGGTWVEDSKGRVLVALDENDVDFNSIGKIGGSKFIQEHIHKGLTWYGQLISYDSGSGAHFQGSLGINNGQSATAENMKTGAVADKKTGTSGNLQPYIVARRWHRIA